MSIRPGAVENLLKSASDSSSDAVYSPLFVRMVEPTLVIWISLKYQILASPQACLGR